VRLEDAPSGTYRGSIVVAEPGTFVFQVAQGIGDGSAVFGGSAISLDVEPSRTTGPEPRAGLPPWLLVAAVIGALVAGGVILLGARRPGP
jgi:hypothetical protein